MNQENEEVLVWPARSYKHLTTWYTWIMAYLWLSMIIFCWSSWCQKVTYLMYQCQKDDLVTRVYNCRLTFYGCTSPYCLSPGLSSIDNVCVIILLLWERNFQWYLYVILWSANYHLLLSLSPVDSICVIMLLLWERNIQWYLYVILWWTNYHLLLSLSPVDNICVIMLLLWERNIQWYLYVILWSANYHLLLSLLSIDNVDEIILLSEKQIYSSTTSFLSSWVSKIFLLIQTTSRDWLLSLLRSL